VAVFNYNFFFYKCCSQESNGDKFDSLSSFDYDLSNT